MNRYLACLVVGASVLVLAQRATSTSPKEKRLMVVAVARDDSVLVGGVSTGKLIADQKLDVEPLAWLIPSGVWKGISCDENHPQKCRQFEKEYLKTPHTYSVVSGDGWGAEVHVGQMSLDDECFGYGGMGTYSGPTITYAAVAASSPDFFTLQGQGKRLTHGDADTIRKAFAAAAGTHLDSMRYLRVYSLRLDGHNLFAIQRAFQDYASLPGYDPQKEDFQFVFAIGTMEQGQFHILSWQNKINNDENEQILGIIHLKNGKDFLVNTISDPETQFFRVYGIRKGQLVMVFAGGGGGC